MCIFWMRQHQIGLYQRTVNYYFIFTYFLLTVIAYLNTRYKYEDPLTTGIVKRMAHKFSLEDWELPSFARCQELAKHLGINMNADHLYEELYDIKKLIPEIVSEAPSQEQNLALTWQTLFKRTTAPNICKLMSFLLSIPPSNANPERVFSIIGEKWREARNKSKMELLKSEPRVAFNFKRSCRSRGHAGIYLHISHLRKFFWQRLAHRTNTTSS